MRSKLIELAKDTILFEFSLPCNIRKIEKSIITNDKDDCYKVSDDKKIATIIYNAILDYSYSEFDISSGDTLKMFSHAFGNKFKYNRNSIDQAKQRLGIYGEALLYIVLYLIYSSKPLISKGCLYNPLERSEAKGYDAYHLIEVNNKTELWFGEAKFYKRYKPAVDRIFENIENVLSDVYFNRNLISISNRRSDLNFKNSNITDILKALSLGNTSLLRKALMQHKIKLIYPILLIFEKDKKDKKGIDESVRNAVDYINKTYSHVKFNNITIDFSVFFIFLPIDNVSLVKKEVIKWIESEKPLI